MIRELLAVDRLTSLTESFKSTRIAVLGDFFLDKYLDVDPALAELSVETGKTAHQVVGVHTSPGAAGTVVNNLAALGAGELLAIGMIGDDGEGFELVRGLEAIGCQTQHLIRSPDHYTPTYLKPRDKYVTGLAGEHSRYDTKLRGPVTAQVEATIAHTLQHLLPEIDAVIVLDQVEAGSTIVTRPIREAIVAQVSAADRLIAWVDSRFHVHEFEHMTVKCNQYEVLGVPQPAENPDAAEAQIDEAELLAAATRLRDTNDARVFVTRGSRGVIVSDPPGNWTHVPAVEVTGEIDSTGAGDSFTAGAVLTLASGGTPTEAAAVGNLVASITVQCLGETGTATPQQLLARLAG